jgi:ribonuclease I
MSYQPEFCYQHRHEKFQGCENPIDFWKESLTLHGLWPQVRISVLVSYFSLLRKGSHDVYTNHFQFWELT